MPKTKRDILTNKTLLEKLKKRGISVFMICNNYSIEQLREIIRNI